MRRFVVNALAGSIPASVRTEVLKTWAIRRPNDLLDVLGPALNRGPNLGNLVFDREPVPPLNFDDLAGLFSSTTLDHGAISMTVRQAAYLFSFIREHRPLQILEIGRYKGGSTFVMAAALAGEGRIDSIDIGEKEARLRGVSATSYDDELLSICKRFGLSVQLHIGDSRTIELEHFSIDLLFIDGDHTYEGAKSDFTRFASRLKPHGSVMFDDAFGDGVFTSHEDTVGRVVQEVVDTGEFRLARRVNRLAHLIRVS